MRTASVVAEEMTKLKFDHASDHTWFADDIHDLAATGSMSSPIGSRRAMAPCRSRASRGAT